MNQNLTGTPVVNKHNSFLNEKPERLPATGGKKRLDRV